MKLSPINRIHIIKAGSIIDKEGIPDNYLFNNYWVKLPNNKEYPFKHLVRIAFQLTEGNKSVWLDFQSNTSYRNYVADLGFEIVYHKVAINFFDPSEITLFQSVAGKHYRKENELDKKNAKQLLPLVKKLNVWSNQATVEGFIFQKDNSWQWSGTFKSYLWIRIYRKMDSRMVYFVLGINKNGELFIELNCQRSNHSKGATVALSSEKIEEFDTYLNESGCKATYINKANLLSYDWNRLIKETQLYITQYTTLYDELEQIVNRDNKKIIKKYSLILSEPPSKTRTHVGKKRSFKGQKIDWGNRQKVSKHLGNEGENLVLLYEKSKLKKIGLLNKSEQVKKMLDGEGYDIKSFDELGNEIHIEVKTTVGSLDEPFYMSINEKEYIDHYPENYYLYRLYDFDISNKSAKFYIIKGSQFDKISLKPTNYEASINN